jgi:hypothetical protein
VDWVGWVGWVVWGLYVWVNIRWGRVCWGWWGASYCGVSCGAGGSDGGAVPLRDFGHFFGHDFLSAVLKTLLPIVPLLKLLKVYHL